MHPRKVGHGALRFVVLALAVALTLVGATASQARETGGAQETGDQFTPLAAYVLSEPNPVLGADRKLHLAYELFLVNGFPLTTTVERLEVLDARSSRVIADLSGAALDAVMGPIVGAPSRVVGTSQVSRALLDVQLEPTAQPPRALVHRLTVTVEPAIPLPTRFLAGQTTVSTDRAVVVGPPLQGQRWVQVAGCCAVGHRAFIRPVNGVLHSGQRFATDIAQLTTDGRLFSGPHDQVTSYPGYGTPVLAAAAGVVVAESDGAPNQVPFAAIEPIDPAEIVGNHVIVDIGEGRFALYAHLKPGSVRVDVGDRVRRGQPLGEVGNSGFTDLPHLHFQLMDGPSALGSEGLPHVLRSFDSRGSVPPLDQVDLTGPLPIGPERSGHFERAIPMDRQVIDYPTIR